MGRMFYSCSSLSSIDLINFNCDMIKNTNYMEEMFKNCNKLEIQNIKHKDYKIRGRIIMDLNK